VVGIFRGKVVDMSHDQIVLEASGNSDKVDTFIELLKPFGVNEVTRSGCVAINRLSPFEKVEIDSEELAAASL
jgi:acetolactate synthase-1/3 small subunit